MQMEKGVGVIVGRFQVAELTPGHREIFEHVLSKGHNQSLVVLGVAPLRATKNNPLDYDARRRMIEDAYPGKFTILYIKDTASDVNWSRELDTLIEDIAGRRPVTLYGSRDSFSGHYTGKYTCEEYQQRLYCSGTQERDAFGRAVYSSPEWRAGCVYATQNRYPVVLAAVTAVVLDDTNRVYLARRRGEDGLSLFHGLVSTQDEGYADAAKRVVDEITGLEVSHLATFGSCWLKDWRFNSEEDQVLSTVIIMRKVFGAVRVPPDCVSVELVSLDSVDEGALTPESRVTWQALRKNSEKIYEFNKRTSDDAVR